jgi:hypothetical protein
LNTKVPSTRAGPASSPEVPPFPISTVPCSIVSAPNETDPLNVSFPAPAFVEAPEPVTGPVISTSLRTVNVFAAFIVTVPPNVSFALNVAPPNVELSSSNTSFPTTRAVDPSDPLTTPPANVSVPDPNAPPSATRTDPARTVNPPENVFGAESVSAPAPSFVTATNPDPPNPRALPIATSFPFVFTVKTDPSAATTLPETSDTLPVAHRKVDVPETRT